MLTHLCSLSPFGQTARARSIIADDGLSDQPAGSPSDTRATGGSSPARRRRYRRIVDRSRSARSQRQRQRPLGQPACGSSGSRSSFEILTIERSSRRQASQHDALVSSASREISAMPRSSAATPSRYRATMSAGGGIGDPAIRYWSVASSRLMRAMASQSCDRLAAAKRLIDGRGVEALAARTRSSERACCSQAFDALCWCSGLRRQEQPAVSIACRVRMAPRSAPFLLEDIERRGLRQVHRPAVDPLDHDRWRHRGQRRDEAGAGSRSSAQ